MRVTKIATRRSFPRWYVIEFFHFFHLTFLVVYGSIKIFQTLMGGAKIVINCSFTRSVTQVFRSFKVTFKVVCGCYKISRTVLGIGKVIICLSFC